MKKKFIYIFVLLTIFTVSARAEEIGSVEKRLIQEQKSQAKNPSALIETQEKAEELINKQETVEKLISSNKHESPIQETEIRNAEGKLIQVVYQSAQHQQIQLLEKYNEAEEKILSVEFNTSGKIQKMNSFDEKSGQLKASVYYDPATLNVYRYDEYSKEGQKIRRIDLSPKTGTVLTITEYSPLTGQPTFYKQVQ